MRSIGTLFILAAMMLLVSCSGGNYDESEEAHGHDHDEHAVAVTLWSDSLELFMEYHPPIAGREMEFLVHLTRLSDFSAIDGGTISIELEGHGAPSVRGASESPRRAGIWVVDVPIPEAGEYHLRVQCVVSGLSETFDAGHVRAWTSEEDLEASQRHAGEDLEHGHDDGGHEGDHAEDHVGGHDEITFLKEQQWNTDFHVERVRLIRMHSSIHAVAEVLPRQQGYAEVVTPVEGLVNVLHNQEMAVPGMRVEPGDRLVTVCPPLEGSGSWTERHLGYLQAKREFERAERLLGRDAIAKRDYEEIRRDYLVKRSSYEMVLAGTSAEPVEVGETGEVHLELKAPVGGIVSAVDILPGQAVSVGQRLMTIIDPSAVWLRANMFERDYYRMGSPEGAAVTVPGLEGSLNIGRENLKVLSRGDLFDRASRTIPVIFETDNPGELLKIGQIVQLEVFTSETIEMVAVPEESVIDEDFGKFIFIQTGGESFEKRPVKTGTKSHGMVAVLEGLAEGERVVTVGAYMVKLASTSKGIGGAHVH